MIEDGISLRVISIDREILPMIFPFEITLKNERLRGTLEYRNDGSIKFHWQTRSQVVLDEEEILELASVLLQELEFQSEAELRDSIRQEIVNLILNDEV
jgi:hypothetical protein